MKNLIGLLALVLTPVILVSSVSSAEVSGLFLRESLSFERNISDGTGSRVTSNSYFTSTSIGYVGWGWAYMGATWNYYKETTDTQQSSGISSTIDYTTNEYGPTYGYIDESWHLLVTYFLLADKQWKTSAPGTTTNEGRNGTGYMLDVGYRFALSPSFQLGPSLIYETITFTNCKDPNTGVTSTCNPTVKEERLRPFISLAIQFQ